MTATTPPEMPEPDYIRTQPYDDTDPCGYEYFDDGDGNPIERYAAEKAQLASSLSEELNRVRTTQAAAAHALDTLRQLYGLDLIDGEHPADTAKRISAEKAAEVERLREMLHVQVRDFLLSVHGSWEAFPDDIREAIGNTNYNLIAENMDAVMVALGGKPTSLAITKENSDGIS